MWKKIVIGLSVAVVIALTATGVIYASSRETAKTDSLRQRSAYSLNEEGYCYRNQNENSDGANCFEERNCEENGTCDEENCLQNREENRVCDEENCGQEGEGNCLNNERLNSGSEEGKEFRGRNSSNSFSGRKMMGNR